MELYKIKNSRQMMEQDKKLLSNWLAKLEKEEAKLLRKIDTMKSRTNRVTKQKKIDNEQFIHLMSVKEKEKKIEV